MAQQSDISVRFARSVSQTIQSLKSMQLSFYEKAADMSEAIDELVSDSFGTSPRPTLQQMPAEPEPVVPQNAPPDQDKVNHLTSKVQTTVDDFQFEYEDFSSTFGLLIVFGAIVITMYMVCIYLRRRRRRRLKHVGLTGSNLFKANIAAAELRLRQQTAGYTIPPFYRAKLDSTNQLHKRAPAANGKTTSAAAGDAGGATDDHHMNYDPHQAVCPGADVPGEPLHAKKEQIQNRSVLQTTEYQEQHQHHSKTKNLTNDTKTSAALKQNPTRLVVAPPRNFTGVAGELQVNDLDRTVTQSKANGRGHHIRAAKMNHESRTSGINHQQMSFTRRGDRHTTLTVLPRGHRAGFTPRYDQPQLQGIDGAQGRRQQHLLSRPWRTQQHQGSSGHHTQHPLQGSHQAIRHQQLATNATIPNHHATSPRHLHLPSNTTSPHRQQLITSRDLISSNTLHAHDDLTVGSTISSTSTRRSQSVSPRHGRYTHRWKSSPIVSTTQRPWHAFQIQAPADTTLTNRSRDYNAEQTEQVTRWAGGLPRERICEIRQKVMKHSEVAASTADKTTKSTTIEKQRTPVRTKPGTALSSATPKRHRDNAINGRRKDGHTLPQTHTKETKVTPRKTVVCDSRRNKGSCAVVSDGRPRFKTDWAALFTSLSAKHPKKKKSKGKSFKKKAHSEAETAVEKKYLVPEHTEHVNKDDQHQIPYKPTPILPIKPLASPLKPYTGNSGEVFGLRKTATPLLSSLSGQGAFTSYVRDVRFVQEPNAPPNSQSSSVWASDINSTSFLNGATSIEKFDQQDVFVRQEAAIESADTIKVDLQTNQARHNTKFLSTISAEPNSSYIDTSLTTTGSVVEASGDIIHKPYLFKGKAHQTLKSNALLGDGDMQKEVDLSKGTSLKFKEIKEDWLKTQSLNIPSKAPGTTVANNLPNAYNSNLLSSSSINNKACNITLSQESRGDHVKSAFSVNLQQPSEKRVNFTQETLKMAVGQAKTVLRNASPLQFQMPMQEPLLSDIAKTFNHSKKKGEHAGRRKSGMGAYLEEAANKIALESFNQISSGITDVSESYVNKRTSNTNKGNTVFRITRNRVTTLKPHQEFTHNADMGSRQITRQHLLQQQASAPGTTAADTQSSVIIQSEKPVTVFKDQPTCPPFSSLADTRLDQTDKINPSQALQFGDSKHKTLFWQVPMNSVIGASADNGQKVTETPARENKFLNEREEKASTINESLRCAIKSKPTNSISQSKPQLYGNYKDGKNNSKDNYISVKENATPQQTQTHRLEHPTLNRVPIKESRSRKSWPQTNYKNATVSSTTDATVTPKDVDFGSPDNLTSASTSKTSPTHRRKQYQAKKSRSLISVSDIHTKLSSSTVLACGGYSPAYRHEYRCSGGSLRQGSSAIRSLRRNLMYQQQKCFHENLRKLRSRRQCRKSASKESAFELKYSPKNSVTTGRRQESLKSNYVRLYKMKKKSKPLRHEPYHKSSNSTLNKEIYSITKAHKTYMARNKNNCSPLRKRHTHMYTPVLGNMADQTSPSSDSVSVSTVSRDREELGELGRTHRYSPELCCRKGTDPYSRTDTQGLHRRLVVDRDDKTSGSVTPRNRQILETPTRTVDLTESNTDQTDTKLATSYESKINSDAKQYKDKTSEIHFPKQKTTNTNTYVFATRKEDNHEVSPEKAADDVFKSGSVDPSSMQSVPTTKSHTTQTETSTQVSQNVAIQTSPRYEKKPVHRFHNRSQSRHIVQKLIRHRSREMRLERSLRHAQGRVKRTRTFPFTAHWVFQQNKNVHNKSVNEQKSSFSNGFTVMQNEDCSKVNSPAGVNTKLNTSFPGAYINATQADQAVFHGDTGENTTRSLLYAAQTYDEKKITTENCSQTNNVILEQEETVRKTNYVDVASTSEVRQNDVENGRQTITPKTLVRQSSTLSKMSEIDRMCLMRPSWQNVNIEEVDRRVKRALRLRRELQLSRSSGERRESFVLNTSNDRADTTISQQKEDISSRSRRNIHSKTQVRESDSSVSEDLDRHVLFRRNKQVDDSKECTETINIKHRVELNENREIPFQPSVELGVNNDGALQHEGQAKEAVQGFSLPRENSFVHTERSMSAQDLPTVHTYAAVGGDRPSSAYATSGPDFNFGNNYLKRTNLATRSKNSPPTKISKVENQACSSNTPRLVGALVQRLPQVPLSSFVEWFIETSDPKNFATSEKSKTSSEDKSSGSKSSSENETAASNKPRDRALYSSMPAEFQESSSSRFPNTSETTIHKDSASSTPCHVKGKLDNRNIVPLQTTNKGRDKDPCRNFKFQTLETGHMSDKVEKKNRICGPSYERKASHTKRISVHHVGTAPTANKSYITDSTPVYPHTHPEIVKHRLPETTERSQDATSTDEEGTASKDSRTFTCDDDTITFEHTLDTNKLYITNPLVSCFEDSDNNIDNNGNDDTAGINKYESDGNLNKCIESEHTPHRTNYGPTSHSVQPPANVSGLTNASIMGSETNNFTSTLNLNLESRGAKECEDDSEQRCAPGIRNILMRLQQSDDESSSQTLNTQDGRYRITLRRSSDVTGIIAKFQDQNNNSDTPNT